MGKENLSQISGLTVHAGVGLDQGDNPVFLLSSSLGLRNSLQHVVVRWRFGENCMAYPNRRNGGPA